MMNHFLNKLPKLNFRNNIHDTGCVNVNMHNLEDVTRFITARAVSRSGYTFATLNLDHIVKMSEDPSFHSAYKLHDAIVVDGFPVRWLSNAPKVNTQILPGSDLIFHILNLCEKLNLSLSIIGTTTDSLESAIINIHQKHPNIKIVYSHSPEFGFDPTGEIAGKIGQELREKDVDICLLALGAPKQERFAIHCSKISPNTGFFSLGASIDFISGHQVRAPLLVRRIGLEWLWRLINNPRRLGKRYLKCAVALPVAFYLHSRIRYGNPEKIIK